MHRPDGNGLCSLGSYKVSVNSGGNRWDIMASTTNCKICQQDQEFSGLRSRCPGEALDSIQADLCLVSGKDSLHLLLHKIKVKSVLVILTAHNLARRMWYTDILGLLGL